MEYIKSNLRTHLRDENSAALLLSEQTRIVKDWRAVQKYIVHSTSVCQHTGSTIVIWHSCTLVSNFGKDLTPGGKKVH
jgi:hypothetical protein